jgi:hypothetical protein
MYDGAYPLMQEVGPVAGQEVGSEACAWHVPIYDTDFESII